MLQMQRCTAAAAQRQARAASRRLLRCASTSGSTSAAPAPEPSPQSLLYIASVWPERTSSAAGLRSWNLLDACRAAGWKLTCSSPAAANRFTQQLEDAGMATAQLPENDARFDEFVQRLQPHVVLFDRFIMEEKFGWRVEAAVPDALRVLDTQDLHFLRRARGAALRGGTSLAALCECRFELVTDDCLRELAAVYRCDLTLLISSFELRLLRQQFNVPDELLALARFVYPDPPPPRPFEERRDVVMIGSFLHAPNVDALEWVRCDVWPRARKSLPAGTCLRVYGAYPSKHVMQMHDPAKGFHVLGPVPDHIGMLSAARVNLAALRFGAGIKGKITDGWYAGTPAAATRMSAEGMHDDDPFGGVVADDADSLADAVAELYCSRAAWEQAQQAGFELLRGKYNGTIFDQAVVGGIRRRYSHLAAARKRNVIGLILRQQSYRATMFMSRWIESKARLEALKTQAPVQLVPESVPSSTPGAPEQPVEALHAPVPAPPAAGS